MPMTPREAAVVDPVLSTQARGYTNSDFIGDEVLPPVDVPGRNSVVVKFGKEDFRKRDTRRAPGAQRAKVTIGYGSETVALKQEALDGVLPDEVADEAKRAAPSIDLGARTVRKVQNIIALGRECEIADLVRNPASYPAAHVVVLAGTDKFTDPASDPQKVVEDLKETIRRKIGRNPNAFEMGAPVFKALRRHPKVKEQFKYVSKDSITKQMLAEYLDLKKIIVGDGVVLPDNAEDDAAAVDIWGNDATLFYQPTEGDWDVPAFGYTYRLRGYPAVMKPYWDEDRDSWVYPTKEEYRPYITGPDAGALIRNAV